MTGLRSPVTGNERLVWLDALRGLAVLGILYMNIQSFSMVSAAYANPSVQGGITGANRLIWLFGAVFAAQKFMTLFSLLYGAGIWLMCERLSLKGINVRGLVLRRSLWLLFIGLLHGVLLWYGDILVSYALTGMLPFLLKDLSAKQLGLTALGLLLVPFLLILAHTLWLLYGDGGSETLSGWQPGADAVLAQELIYRGSWWEQMVHRLPGVIKMNTATLGMFTFWRSGGLMLLGIALMKWGVLTAAKPKAFYGWMIVVGSTTGLTLSGIGAWLQLDHDFSMVAVRFSMLCNYWGSLFLAAAYTAVILSIQRGILLDLLAPVGRMALSNYLMQSVICTLLYYGHGEGMFGRMDRLEQSMVVLHIWLFQILFSKAWLAYFRFGPAEWIWRSLTYWQAQPMVRPSI